jgi:putative ABC transport system ATP-binding protein
MSNQDQHHEGLALEAVTATVPDGTDVRVLLDQVRLTVSPGEVVAITGPSGSGKSTLLSLAGLLLRPEAGDVLVSGVSTATLSEAKRTALRRRHVGIVYQSANLLAPLTAIEQLEMVGRINGARHADSSARAMALLDEVGLADRASMLPSVLSGGERQRVGIARALMANPTVLLADEPTASLDPALAGEIAALLADQTRLRSLATVIVTHDEEPLRHADRILDLSGGQLRAHQTMRS